MPSYLRLTQSNVGTGTTVTTAASAAAPATDLAQALVADMDRGLETRAIGPPWTLQSCTSDAEKEMRSILLESAANLVIDHGESVRAAADAYQVPKSSVHRRVLARKVGCEQGKCDIEFLCHTRDDQ